MGGRSREGRIVLEVLVDLPADVDVDAAGDALARLLRMAGGVLEGISVREAVVLGRSQTTGGQQ